MYRLFDIPHGQSDRIFLQQPGTEPITYRQIARLLPQALCAELEGRVVLCKCRVQIEMIAGFLALEQAGAVPLLVDDKLPDERCAELAELYGADWIWAPADASLQEQGQLCLTCRGYSLTRRAGGPYHPALHKDLALLLSTSGSTGSPKMVRLSRDNIRANTRQLIRMGRFVSEDVGLVFLPMSHCFSVGLIHILYAVGGQAVCLPGGIMNPSFRSVTDDFRVTMFISVTFVLEFLRRIGFFAEAHPSLRLVAHGGGFVPEELQRFLVDWAAKYHKQLVLAYGQTECTMGISSVPMEELSRRFLCAGKPADGVEMWIADPDPSGVGNLMVRSPSVMMGYAYSARDLARGDEQHGVVDTGDLARLDADGYVYIMGRKARFAKLLGERISLDETEEKLRAHFPDGQFACTSDDRVITIYTACTAAGEEILEEARRSTGLNRLLFRLRRVREIPRSETGKILYGALQKEEQL